MSLTVVTRQTHAEKYWLHRTSFAFAASDTVTPLLASEVAAAGRSLPMAFIKHDNVYVLVAVMGLAANENLLVSRGGAWLDYYMPVNYRTGPFRLAADDEGNMLLCVDENTGLVSDSVGDEKFFEEDGQVAQPVNDILALLGQIDTSRKLTDNICAVLGKHELLEPWVINLDGPNGEQQIDGLYRLNEAALNALPDEAFLEVRNAHALPVAYSQLISMQNINAIAQLFAQRIAVQAQESLSETFSFSNLQ